jgi:hypothetical protein
MLFYLLLSQSNIVEEFETGAGDVLLARKVAYRYIYISIFKLYFESFSM